MRSRVLILLGVLLILGALGLVGYNLLATEQAEVESAAVLRQLGAIQLEANPGTPMEQDAPAPESPSQSREPEETAVPDYLLDPTREMPTVEIDGVKYVGTLQIPSIEIELPIAAEWSYAKLRIAPCRYSGTAYQDDLVLCAHNYTSHFGKIGNLRVGAEVRFTDMDGNLFRYEVASVEVLRPTAVDAMVDSPYPLSLFTCTIGNRTRLTVRCDRLE